MLTDSELARVQNVASRLGAPVTLRLASGGAGSQFETNLRHTALQMNGVSLNAIRFEEVADSSQTFLPFISVARNDVVRVRYFSVPEGPELEPFLEVLAWVGSKEYVSDYELTARQASERETCEMLIFIAPTCPHCPGMVRKCIALATEIPELMLSIVNALYFSEWSGKFKVQATPTIVIDNGFTIVGNQGLDELRSYILRRNDPEFMTQILQSMINNGRAEDAAMLICERKCADALLPLYASPVFTQRMGALLAMEEALAKDRRILDPVLEQLISLTSHEDDGIRGDTAELLGNIGDRRAMSALQALKDDPNEDVREAASEALEKLNVSD